MEDDRSIVGPRSTFEAYRAEGDMLFKQQEYKKALESYDLAMELRPEDRNCFVTRSRCYLQMGDTENALKDAEQSMKDEPTFFKGILCKADALYFKGDFEMALVFYHRGNKLRPEQHEFRLGIQKCQEAIDNSVGAASNIKLENKGDLSYFYKPQKEEKKKAYSVRQLVPEKKMERPISGRKDKTIKQLLGELYADREFLESLLKEEDAREKKTETSRKIHELVLHGLVYLDTRTDFWRQQKPMYARNRDRAARQAQFDRRKGSDPSKYVLNNLTDIDEAQTRGRFKDSLRQSTRVLATVESWSTEELANKLEITANLYSCIGNAHLELGDFGKALEFHEKDYTLGDKHGIEDSKSRAMDNIGRVQARTGRFDEAIEIWERKLPMSKSALESAWLQHEIGRCYLEKGSVEKAQEYGEKSYTAAREADDDVWQLNSSVLVAQCELRRGDMRAAHEAFSRSLDMAKAQQDKTATRAIRGALAELNQRMADEEDDRKAVTVGEGENSPARSSHQPGGGESLGQQQQQQQDGGGRDTDGYAQDFEEDEDAEVEEEEEAAAA